MIGNSDATKDSIHIIDFGLSRCYRNQEGFHIPYAEGKTLTGTSRYASLNAQLGVDQSRRDDLEAIGNMLVYFAKGTLPWANLFGKTKAEQ